jgi:hypothetical protein
MGKMIWKKALSLILVFCVLVHPCQAEDLEGCLSSAFELFTSETHAADVEYSQDLIQAQADKDYAIQNAVRVAEVAIATLLAIHAGQTAMCIATYGGLPPPFNTTAMSICFAEIAAMMQLELDAIAAVFASAMLSIEAIYLYQILVAQSEWFAACENVSEAYETRKNFCHTLYP